jgi:exopolysaccharide biosynthesis polyprenyl glycosylphosphotransferase
LIHFHEDEGAELHNLRKHTRKPQAVLSCIEKGLRATDIIGYLGHDVIGILLPDTDETGGRKLVEKLVNGKKDLPFAILRGTYPDELFSHLNGERLATEDLSILFLEDFSNHRTYQYVLKRAMDILGAVVGLLLLSPVMVMTALAVKATSAGPIIFKQTRLGKKGKPFVFYKFRSMNVKSDDKIHREYVTSLITKQSPVTNHGSAESPLFKIRSDPRITPVGHFIRKTSIDELPQLFNVLKGDMSLVGPRPPLAYETENYQSWHLRRILEAKPGITGLWQVSGRSRLSFDAMVRLDLTYARTWSLTMDMKIILKTFGVVIRGTGAV